MAQQGDGARGWGNSWDPSQGYYKDLPVEERKRWYDPVAEAYDQSRPRYPAAILDWAMDVAGLTAGDRLLEIGCGPGIATVDLAARGFELVALEPSGAAAAIGVAKLQRIARQACAAYPRVTVQTTTFEEWPLEASAFDAVVTTTSFHWLSPEVRHSKTAAALKPGGTLILLWNVPPQPAPILCAQLTPLYAEYAPQIPYFEDHDHQEQQLRALGDAAVATGLYEELGFKRVECDRIYSVTDYLMLLSTLSPYIALEAQQQKALFTALNTQLSLFGDSIETSYFSAAHILRLV